MTVPPAAGPPTPWLYRLTGAVVRLVLRLYFSHIRVERADRLPPAGPLLIAANHPSSVADALILGVITRRVVHYMAHAGLFRQPLLRRFLLGCGVIPVHRRHGPESVAERNREAFAAAIDVLARGGVIGIFPEGTSDSRRTVTGLRTGTARIGLAAEAANGFRLGVRIVPVGMNFESLTRFRKGVLLNVGRPLVVAEYRDAYAADPVAAARRLTADLEQRIQRLVVHAQDGDHTDLIDDLTAIYLAELKEHVQALPVVGERPPAEFALTRAIADAVQRLQRGDRARLERLARRVRLYRRQLRRFELSDRWLRGGGGEPARVEALAAVARLALLGLGGLPAAVLGATGNVVPYLITELSGRWLAADVTKVTTTQLITGCVAFVGWYGLLLLGLPGVLGRLSAVGLVAMLPVTGVFTLWYLRWIRYHARHARFRYLEWVESKEIARLRAIRRSVMAEIDGVRDAVLAGEYPASGSEHGAPDDRIDGER